MSNVPSGFRGFMAYYDSVHQNRWNRLFHAFAFTQAIVGFSLLYFHPAIGAIVAVASYAWAWAGHFVFEKNTPATFHSPVRSLVFGFVWYFILAATLGRGLGPAPSPAPR